MRLPAVRDRLPSASCPLPADRPPSARRGGARLPDQAPRARAALSVPAKPPCRSAAASRCSAQCSAVPVGRVRTRVAHWRRQTAPRASAPPSAGTKLHSLGALLAEIKTEDPTGLFVWRAEEEEVGGAVDPGASCAAQSARVAARWRHLPPCPPPPGPHPTPQAPIWEQEERFRRTPLVCDDVGHVEPPPAMFAPPAEEEPLPNHYGSGFCQITPAQLVAAREDGWTLGQRAHACPTCRWCEGSAPPLRRGGGGCSAARHPARRRRGGKPELPPGCPPRRQGELGVASAGSTRTTQSISACDQQQIGGDGPHTEDGRLDGLGRPAGDRSARPITGAEAAELGAKGEGCSGAGEPGWAQIAHAIEILLRADIPHHAGSQGHGCDQAQEHGLQGGGQHGPVLPGSQGGGAVIPEGPPKRAAMHPDRHAAQRSPAPRACRPLIAV